MSRTTGRGVYGLIRDLTTAKRPRPNQRRKKEEGRKEGRKTEGKGGGGRERFEKRKDIKEDLRLRGQGLVLLKSF
jgi:hypothetical protein